MSEFDAGAVKATLVLDRTAFQQGIDQARATAKKFAGEKFTITLDADASPANRKVDELRAKVAKLSGGTIAIDADTAKASSAISGLQAKVDRLSGGSIRVDADTSAAANKLNALGAQLARLTQQRHTVRVDADTARAQNQLNALGGQIQRIAGQRASVQVDADTALARAQLAAMQQALNRLDGQRANANVGVSGGGQATTILAAIVAGLGAVGAAAPAAAAALAAIPSALGVAAQGIGAVMSGFSGVGDAMKAVESQEKSGASTATSAAKQRASAARQIVNAQAGVQQAEEQAARAAIQSAQQVGDAQAQLQQARQQQARTAVQGASQIASAERQLASTVVSVRERIVSAEATLQNAQRSRQYAQEALTRATEDATRANRDLQLSVSGAALSEERATLSLAQARKRLADNKSTDPLETADLSLSVREAEQNLKEVQNRYSDLQGEQSKWARTGVQGSDQVVQATRALEDAQRGVGDAQKGLTSAQVQGAQQIADAQRNVQETVASVAQANADAADAVAQAQQGVQRAVQQAAWSQQDSARSVASAQRALADAYASAAESATGGASATNKAAEALAKLSPAGRDFVNFLQNEWKPAWEQSSKDVAERMLPGIEAGMRSLLKLQPMMTASMSDTGVIIGDLASRAGALMDSGPFRRDFASIMASNNRMISDLGEAGLSLFGALTSLAAVAGPVVERFTRLAEYSAQAFESWIIGEQASGDLERGLQSAGDTLMWLGGILIDVAGDVLEVAQNFAPLGAVLLEAIRWTTDFAAGLTSLLGPGLTSVVGGAALAAIGISKLGTAMSGLALAQGAGGIKGFATVVGTLLNPAALNASAAMSGLRDNFAKAGYAAGSSVAGVTGWSGAAEKGYSAGSKLGSAVSKVGSTLPLVGAALIATVAANDAMNTSFEEGVDLWAKGGQAASDLAAELARNSQVFDQAKTAAGGYADYLGYNWVRQNIFGIETTDSFNQKLEEQRSKMSNLERAQMDASKAQGDYEQKLRDFGAASPQAVQALQNLNDRSRDVEIAQIAVKEKTDLATAAMLYQRDQMLGTLDANLRKRQATQDLARDQQALADAIKQHGPASAEAEAASIQLEQTQLRVGEAARAGKDGINEQARAIGDMVTKTKGDLTPTLIGMVNSLDGAGLAAAGATVKIDDTGRAVATFPNGKTVVLDANNSLALQGLDGVMTKLGAIPAGKTINVGVLDQAAQISLQSIGITVQQLPDGTVNVTAQDDQARATLLAFQLYGNAVRTNPAIAANPQLAHDTLAGFINQANREVGIPGLSANPAEANRIVDERLGVYNRSWSTMPVTANTHDADVRAGAARDNASKPVAFGLSANPDYKGITGFFNWLGDMISGAAGGFAHIFGTGGMNEVRRAMGLPPVANGGPIYPHAAGGLVGYASGGLLRGPGTGTSDSILGLDRGGMPTAMVSNGEYVVRAAAVQSMGLPAMNAINAMGRASGGLIGLAVGGPAPLGVGMTAGATATGAAGATGTSAATAAPTGDPAAATATAAATDTLAASMGTATSAAATLNPMLATLAATQAGVLAPSTDAVTIGQQNLVAAGVNPLVAALAGTLFPTLGVYADQVGVQAPLANTALQTAQTGTQVSTNVTAANTALNSTLMAGAITAMALTGQAQHFGLQLAQGATQASTNATATNTAVNSANMATSTTNMSLINQGQLANLRFGQGMTQQSATQTAINTAGNNANMIATTGNMSATNQGHLAGLRGAQGVTNVSTIAFADSWRAQLGRTMPDSANPIRWVINFPIRSITDAWNTLDSQFALGKHVNPPIAGFAAGGLLHGPGTGTSDSILGVGANGMPTARVSAGEFVVRQAVAKRVTPFLSALNSGDGEALQAAGGTMVASPRKYRGKSGIGLAGGGPVEQRIQAAFAWLSGPARGARYVYGGGTNPAAGMDCSSMQSAVTHILSGRPPNSGRIGSTGTMPWGGFARGQGSRYVIGNKPNDHMAATLAGRNVEQHGPTGTPFQFPSRWGADAPYFTARYFLPEVGGSFVSGGVGAGGGIDVGPIVDGAFAKTYAQIADVPRFFGPSAQVGRDQGVARSSADAVKAKAMDAVSAATASSAVMDVSGISGAVVDQVRQVAARYGWNAGPEWDAIFKIVAKESSWNPGAASKISSARGLFQKMTSLNGPVEPTPAGQAAWGLNYIKNRYGTPTRAWAFHQSHNWYDEGGWLPQGSSMAVNHTGKRENKAVFTEDQWKTMQGQAEAQRRGNTGSSSDIDYDRLATAIVTASGPRTNITVQPRAGQSEEKIGAAVRRELDWAGRVL